MTPFPFFNPLCLKMYETQKKKDFQPWFFPHVFCVCLYSNRHNSSRMGKFKLGLKCLYCQCGKFIVALELLVQRYRKYHFLIVFFIDILRPCININIKESTKSWKSFHFFLQFMIRYLSKKFFSTLYRIQYIIFNQINYYFLKSKIIKQKQ